jgi:hypothetical protein
MNKYKRIAHAMKQPFILGLPFAALPIVAIAVVIGLLLFSVLSATITPMVGILTALIIPCATFALLKQRIKKYGQDISFSKARKKVPSQVRFDLHSIMPGEKDMEV